MAGFDQLAASGRVQTNVPLGSLTTYKLGGPARYFIQLETDDDLSLVADALQVDPQPILIVGRGSNLVVADSGWTGLAMQFGAGFSDFDLDDAGRVTAGAAVPLPRLARQSVSRGRGGLEFFVGIPGSVGGAVRMNAGGHGSDTAEWLVQARVFDLATGTWKQLDVEELDFHYRSSAIGPADLVVSAVFKTVPRAVEDGKARLREITRWRRQHQPGGTLNAGSVFRNPEGDAAGRIIDGLGLKGFRIGGAAVSKKHANFFEAGPDATAQDVYDLVKEIQRIVREKTEIDLVPEVQFAGTFT